jgi:hypothetical protein
MSGRKDRERAESGLIFRDGHLVRKEDWYKTHPTREMLAKQQVVVDAGVRTEMAKLFPKQEIVQPDKVIDVPLPSIVVPIEVPNRYYCTACRKHHIKSSKIGSEHTNFYLAE